MEILSKKKKTYFIFSERLYLLHLAKTLLTNDGHEYKAEYESCLNKIGFDALAAKLKSNLEVVTRAKAPTRDKNGVLVTGQQVLSYRIGLFESL